MSTSTVCRPVRMRSSRVLSLRRQILGQLGTDCGVLLWELDRDHYVLIDSSGDPQTFRHLISQFRLDLKRHKSRMFEYAVELPKFLQVLSGNSVLAMNIRKAQGAHRVLCVFRPSPFDESDKQFLRKLIAA